MHKTNNPDRMVNLSKTDQQSLNQILADEWKNPTIDPEQLDRFLEATKYFEVRDPNSKKYKYGGLDEDQIEVFQELFPKLKTLWKYDGDWNHSFDRLKDFQERIKIRQEYETLIEKDDV